MSASIVQNSIKSALTKLPSKFLNARKTGALYFFESEVKSVEEHEKRFEVRVCPALQDKAKAKQEADAKVGKSSDDEAESKKSSPFEPPYIEDLFVGDVEGTEGEEGMVILLNKYSIIPEHLLLCSKTQQPQSMPPTPSQLLSAYLTIHAASKIQKKRMLAFYNGGENAGASQSWRHLQVVGVDKDDGIPMDEWMEGLEVERKDKPFVVASLPHLQFSHHLPPIRNLPATWTEDSLDRMEAALARCLMGLLDCMFQALRMNDGDTQGGWNLLMTLDHLHLIPRSKPNYPLPSGSKLEVNSMAFAGMLLVKSEEEFEALQKYTSSAESDVAGDQEETKGLMKVLKYCGVPRAWGEWQEGPEGPLAGSED